MEKEVGSAKMICLGKIMGLWQK